jgi:hypothetical protein
MAFRFNTYGTCRAPGCNKSLRTNGGAVYCYSHASIDIRYGTLGRSASRAESYTVRCAPWPA